MIDVVEFQPRIIMYWLNADIFIIFMLTLLFISYVGKQNVDAIID